MLDESVASVIDAVPCEASLVEPSLVSGSIEVGSLATESTVSLGGSLEGIPAASVVLDASLVADVFGVSGTIG